MNIFSPDALLYIGDLFEGIDDDLYLIVEV